MKDRSICLLTSVLLAALLFATARSATGTSMLHRNVVDLVELSELILVGKITAVDDGFDNGVPYTEITLSVSEAIKGEAEGLYTFRQFGLRAPRERNNGKTNLGLSPQGWPRFAAGDEVVLFLHEKASKTGLRTTVGLLQGTFKQTSGGLVNGIGNQGLFRNLAVKGELLTPAEERMLDMKKGPVRSEAFVPFVRKAVRGKWIERGKLEHVH
jgi:hypothetical protein